MVLKFLILSFIVHMQEKQLLTNHISQNTHMCTHTEITNGVVGTVCLNSISKSGNYIICKIKHTNTIHAISQCPKWMLLEISQPKRCFASLLMFQVLRCELLYCRTKESCVWMHPFGNVCLCKSTLNSKWS